MHHRDEAHLYYTLTHHHFIYDTEKRQAIGEKVSFTLECSKKNFPYKCFYNDEKQEVYSFYRQGHSLKVKIEDENPEKWTY